MIRIYSNALDLPPKYYPAIGEIIFRWAQLEHQMQEIIWHAVGIGPKEGRMLTVGMNARTLTAMLGTLSLRWLANQTEMKMANTVMKGVNDIADFRNQLAHGTWQYPEGGKLDDVYLHYMKENKHQRILPHARKHHPRQITATATKLKRLNETAQKLIGRIQARQNSFYKISP